jgi:hypothetical protein
MSLDDTITRMGNALDAYAARAHRRDIAAEDGDLYGVPPAMADGPVDEDGWVGWRMHPSTIGVSDVDALQGMTGHSLPPSFRAYLLARCHLFDQVHCAGRQQLVSLPRMPSDDPLAHLRQLIEAWRPLLVGGYVPFAQWGDGWGPMCFDTCAVDEYGEYSIVWFDHEQVYFPVPEGYSTREWVEGWAEPLYGSFQALFNDAFCT